VHRHLSFAIDGIYTQSGQVVINGVYTHSYQFAIDFVYTDSYNFAIDGLYSDSYLFAIEGVYTHIHQIAIDCVYTVLEIQGDSESGITFRYLPKSITIIFNESSNQTVTGLAKRFTALK
jgi:hypothetical protein